MLVDQSLVFKRSFKHLHLNKWFWFFLNLLGTTTHYDSLKPWDMANLSCPSLCLALCLVLMPLVPRLFYHSSSTMHHDVAGVFHLMMLIIMLNLLIAMMSTSFNDIQVLITLMSTSLNDIMYWVTQRLSVCRNNSNTSFKLPEMRFVRTIISTRENDRELFSVCPSPCFGQPSFSFISVIF